MDLVSLIGTILAFVVIIVGTILKGSTVGALLNPAAFVIVFFGTAASLMVQTPGAVLKRALGMFPLIYKPPVHRPADLILRVIGWSEISRRQGLLGLEAQIETEPDGFMKKGLQLLVDGGEPEAIRSVLEVELSTREHVDLVATKVYENAGIYSPTLGIIGAVMGLMAVMQNLADPSKLGHGIAAAFVATIYGVALANMLMLPMSARLKGLVHKQTQMREIFIEGLVSIAQGDNPRQIEAKLQGYLFVKRKHHEEHLNHEAWAIPYADLMTLLLAFFVVMYAVSVVNEGKYRVMSQSISEAFNGSSHVIAPMPKSGPARNAAPALAAPPGESGAAAMPIMVPIPGRPAPVRMVDSRKAGSKVPPQTSAARTVGAQQENLGRIQSQVQHALQPLIDKQMVIVRRTSNWLEIEIRTDILFPSGVAQLTRPADAVLNSLAGILAPFSNPLRVEGYTDDKPIKTAVYPSNWELSAARAASVARLFADQGVSPNRMGIIGWGEFRPAADNATVEGRNRNRRVLVVVLSDHATPTRFYSDADHAGELAGGAPAADTASPAAAAGHGPKAHEAIVPSLPPPPAIASARTPLSVPEMASATTFAGTTSLDAQVSAAILPAVRLIRPAAAAAAAGNPLSTAKGSGGPLAASAPVMLTTGARP